jgi:hypothetical protein
VHQPPEGERNPERALSAPVAEDPLQPDSPVLDAASISALRAFFELLDAWDQEENTDEK